MRPPTVCAEALREGGADFSQNLKNLKPGDDPPAVGVIMRKNILFLAIFTAALGGYSSHGFAMERLNAKNLKEANEKLNEICDDLAEILKGVALCTDRIGVGIVHPTYHANSVGNDLYLLALAL